MVRLGCGAGRGCQWRASCGRRLAALTVEVEEPDDARITQRRRTERVIAQPTIGRRLGTAGHADGCR